MVWPTSPFQKDIVIIEDAHGGKNVNSKLSRKRGGKGANSA
jgi:hypothetical protein